MERQEYQAIVDSFINGQFKQAICLFEELNIGDKLDFITYLDERQKGKKTKYYQLLIIDRQQNIYKPLRTTDGREYIFPSENSAKQAYQSLYYQVTFIPLEKVAKISEIELTNIDEYCLIDFY